MSENFFPSICFQCSFSNALLMYSCYDLFYYSHLARKNISSANINSEWWVTVPLSFPKSQHIIDKVYGNRYLSIKTTLIFMLQQYNHIHKFHVKLLKQKQKNELYMLILGLIGIAEILWFERRRYANVFLKTFYYNLCESFWDWILLPLLFSIRFYWGLVSHNDLHNYQFIEITSSYLD